MALSLVACDPSGEPDAGEDAGLDDAGLGDAGLDAGVSTAPADVYFALAVTDDSHNHTGDRLLFLDFPDNLGRYSTDDTGNRVVRAAAVDPSTLTLDGQLDDWSSISRTEVNARPQNNYPLSDHLDAVPVPVEVAAAFDDEYVYFAARWEDPGHVASLRRRIWTYDAMAAEWRPALPAAPLSGALNENVVNAADPLAGLEDEDRLFFMFPIEDPDGFFSETSGLGCAGLCHGHLNSAGLPDVERTGLAAVMNAGSGSARFDVWEWKATRTAPSGVAEDSVLLGVADPMDDGMTRDTGEAAFVENIGGGGQPAFMHPDGFSQGTVLTEAEAVALSGTPADGDTVPRYLSRPPTGSRADVEVAHHYDEATFTWTLEVRRRRDTGNDDDRAFVPGPDAAPPNVTTRPTGSVASGAPVYMSLCVRCHGTTGQGQTMDSMWVFPRIQRAGGSLTAAALSRVEMMRGLPVDEAALADIAAFLRQQHTPPPP